MDHNQIINSTKAKMQKAIEVLRDDFGTVKTGKAAPQLVENVVINAYQGTARLKIMELATIHVVDPSTIAITPFDQSVLRDIEKGLSDSQMGLGIAVDGALVRITIPPLTQERREEFVKMVHKKAENGKIITIDINEELEDFTRQFFKDSEFASKIDYRIGDAALIIPNLEEVFDRHKECGS